jgi:hypothetical protein
MYEFNVVDFNSVSNAVIFASVAESLRNQILPCTSNSSNVERPALHVLPLPACNILASYDLRPALLYLRNSFYVDTIMATPNSDSPPPSNVTTNVITLHILSPAPEVTGGRITFPSISLDTTISQLKARLQNSITAAPPPERQRLIYRGRALVDVSSTLKSVFQSEVR